jgi:integrase
MTHNGYSPQTIKRRYDALTGLVKLGANLDNPDSVKETIAKQQRWKASQKQVVVFAYDLYIKQYNITWQRPKYNAVRELPFIPQEREVDDLIAGVNKEISLLLLIAKETGARAGEVYGLLWTDIDFESRTLSIRAEKNSNPRRFTMSKKLQNILECRVKTTEHIFTYYLNLNNLRRSFEYERKRLAKKLCNPRLNQIKIHTLRHWKGTTEYSKTKDILHVMQTLGHKNIKNTLLYTQLVQSDCEQKFTCKIARTPEEALVLIEAGYEEHTSFDNGETKLFRKRLL